VRILLTVLLDELELAGTKYGSSQGQCGTCTVKIEGVVTQFCQTWIAAAAGKNITTIEGVKQKESSSASVE